jgi:hypothetical protein
MVRSAPPPGAATAYPEQIVTSVSTLGSSRLHGCWCVVLALLMVGLAACAGQAASANSPTRVLVGIYDQGSTNTPRWILTIYRDGGGSLSHDRSRNRTFRPGTFHAVALANALHTVDSAIAAGCSGGRMMPPVMVGSGSVSFSSIAWLVYRGREIRSLCMDSPGEMALAARLSGVVATAHP